MLRRIGRLPKDKAVEISRQLCAALAAAHDEGVLHRDLKPANIMLDGRGRVKLTDFGLAAVAEVRAGTPVYMAPEQLAGEEVSVQSDIYSLGLVLYELFTGQRVFTADSFDDLSRQHQSGMTTSLTRSGEFDPAVDRVIHRCLERNPSKRPESALAVAAGLPGADPLAAALAAGETPSPEMVAEAGGEGSLPVAVALPVLLGTVVLAVVVGLLQSSLSVVSWVPFDMPPVMLEARALEVAQELGYTDEFADDRWGFFTDLAYVDWLIGSGEFDDDAREVVAGGRPEVVGFWWRGSPSTMVPLLDPGLSPSAPVSPNNPPRTEPGMVTVQLDTTGRLIWFDAVPPRLPAEDAPAEPDWDRLFALMELDRGAFEPVEPGLLPRNFADRRAAWEGVYPEAPEVSLRIEAAAVGGRVTSLRTFSTFEPLLPAQPAANDSGSTTSRVQQVLSLVVIALVLIAFLVTIFGGLYVARRNVRSGRGDTRGARRLGFGIPAVLMFAWFLGEHTVSGNDVNYFLGALVFVAAMGGLTWALYLAVEPFMRRHAPEALIGWSRAVDGRLTDSLVARDVLLGCALGALSRAIEVGAMALAEPGTTAANYTGFPLRSIAAVVVLVVNSGWVYITLGLALSFLYGLTFVLFRRRHVPAFAFWLVFLGGVGFLPGVTVNDAVPSLTTATSVAWWSAGRCGWWCCSGRGYWRSWSWEPRQVCWRARCRPSSYRRGTARPCSSASWCCSASRCGRSADAFRSRAASPTPWPATERRPFARPGARGRRRGRGRGIRSRLGRRRYGMVTNARRVRSDFVEILCANRVRATPTP